MNKTSESHTERVPPADLDWAHRKTAKKLLWAANIFDIFAILLIVVLCMAGLFAIVNILDGVWAGSDFAYAAANFFSICALKAISAVLEGLASLVEIGIEKTALARATNERIAILAESIHGPPSL